MSNQFKKILIVEDEKSMAKAMRLKLNKENFKAKAVFNGEEALQVIGEEKFDLIILDLMMPKMNGFEVLQKLKERNNKTPVIVASNLSQEEDVIKVKKLGAVDFFIKSNTPIKELVESVKKILEIDL